jgi:gamma-glutamyltranspeptidase/glutathione hydrolase
MKTTLFLFLFTALALAQDGEGGGRNEPIREQARSMVITKYGIVATSQTLASAAGAKALEAGGNAIDAAIAANATLGLVEPTGNGMGGDLFAIIYEARTKKLYGLNSSGWSPSGMTIELMQSKGIKERMPFSGIYSVTVPGAVAGWDAMHKKFGKLAWTRLFEPAIGYAEEGFPVTELISQRWHSELPKLKSPEASRIWLPGGKPPVPGQWFRNPTLAKSLRLVSKEGRDGLYRGPIAEAIVAVSKTLGGTFTFADLAEFQAEWIEPISVDYRGWKIFELPPNGHGIAALEMLNIMERFPLASYGHNSVKALHVMIEAKKLAYADMLKYSGDMRFAKVPVAEMISKDLGAKHAAEIDAEKASCKVTPASLISMSRLPGADTIYMTTIDAEGNMVSLIQSNFGGFGSGVVPLNVGFMLQNRASLFSLEHGHPNELVPHKRPLHTIIPGFMQKDDVKISFGIMGGWNQSQAHAQFVSNVVDFGMNIQAAMEAPRFTKSNFDGCNVSVESRVAEPVREELKKLGHDLRVTPPYSQSMGGGQVVMQNGEGIHFGASDPRKDGTAVPQSPVFWKQ